MKSSKLSKNLLITLGWLSFSVGVLGIFLPLFPTTVFWIIAVWLWSKSSPQLVKRIYQNPRYGQGVKDFMEHGIVSRKAKYLAVSSMAFSFLLILVFANNRPLTNIIVGATLASVALWLSTRRENAEL